MSFSDRTVILYSQDRTIVMLCHGMYLKQNEDDEFDVYCDTVNGVPVGTFKKKNTAMEVIRKFAYACADGPTQNFIFKIPEDPETMAKKEEWQC